MADKDDIMSALKQVLNTYDSKMYDIRVKAVDARKSRQKKQREENDEDYLKAFRKHFKSAMDIVAQFTAVQKEINALSRSAVREDAKARDKRAKVIVKSSNMDFKQARVKAQEELNQQKKSSMAPGVETQKPKKIILGQQKNQLHNLDNRVKKCIADIKTFKCAEQTKQPSQYFNNFKEWIVKELEEHVQDQIAEYLSMAGGKGKKKDPPPDDKSSSGSEKSQGSIIASESSSVGSSPVNK